MGKNENEETKADIQLLLECLEYQKGNNSAVKQALVTLSSALCESASSNAQDIFRSAGGIQKILDIVTKAKADEIIEVGLFCLGNAVEKNVYSQKLLSNASFFNLLHGILSPSSSTTLKKRQMAAFVLLCLVSNNSFGQNMSRQSSCLHDILSLIRTSLSRGSDSFGSRDVELWTTLVRAACVCVNNPVNEENQRICSTLFPYLLSIVGKHTEDRVLKSALSLMCLTISYNAQNQGKLARCGGLQILIRKLKSLLNDKEDPGKQQVTVQLICTLDVCLTENESISKVFGELGGVVLVLNMLLVAGLSSQDKIQLVLTLAHAVDAYSPNRDSLSQGNGIKILIQQMTETTNEELTKTTKYLLHMCVSTDNTISDDDGDDELPKMDAFATKLEEMKRKSDLEILQKLNDLDSKLNVIGNRDPDTTRTMYENVGSLGNPETYLSDISELQSHQFSARPASVCSSNDTSCKHRCPTPREKTLLEELVKERVEKEKLEKLNQLLQEDVVSSRAALAKETENQKHSRTKSKRQEKEESDTSHHQKSFLQYQTINPYKDSSNIHKQFGCEINELQKNQNLNAGFLNASSMNSLNPNPNFFYKEKVLPPPILYDDIIYQSEFGPQNNVLYAYPVFDSARDAQGTIGRHSNPNGKTFSYETSNNTTTGMPVDLTVDNSKRPMMDSLQKETVSLVNGNTNKNLNHNVQVQTQTKSSVVLNGKNMNVSENLNTNLIEKQNEAFKVRSEEPNKVLNSNNSSITRSQSKQNAEIQCGTPYVNSENTKDVKINSHSDGCSQTYFQTRSNTQKRKLIPVSTGTTSPGVNNETAVNEIASASSKDSCDKVAKVAISNVLSAYSLKDKSQRSQSYLTVNKHIVIKENGENQVKQPTTCDTFVKPMAAPPRKKVRVTPLMGSKKVLNRSDSGAQKGNFETNQTPYFSDLESEFDLQLVRAIKNPNKNTVRIGEINPSMIYGKNNQVKSQNNTRKIDRHLDDSRQDATQTWNVTPNTPENRHVIPVRPAFSDCGTRRFNTFDSPFSVKSVGCLGKNNLNDNGMNTPTDIKQGSPDSSLDSSIEGCRSSSDVSDEDINILNITASALRSNKKRLNPKLCPGCNNSSDDKGNPLTSRTYNIALERNPHTCKNHRKLRVYERGFIKSTKQQVSKGMRKSGRLLNFNNSSAKNFNSNSFDYISSISDQDNLSPPDHDDDSVLINFKHHKNSKKRRQRLSYTREEEDNLKEGVRTIGKHWNQILNTYSFHPSRTNVDLMDKYKRMVAIESGGLSEMNSTKSSRCSKPFSLCEERRLRKGVKNFGHNWKAILKSFSFETGRTSEDLRDRWRVLHKHLGLD